MKTNFTLGIKCPKCFNQINTSTPKGGLESALPCSRCGYVITDADVRIQAKEVARTEALSHAKKAIGDALKRFKN